MHTHTTRGNLLATTTIPPKPPNIPPCEEKISYKDKLIGELTNNLGDLNSPSSSSSPVNVQHNDHAQFTHEGKVNQPHQITLTEQDIKRFMNHGNSPL